MQVGGLVFKEERHGLMDFTPMNNMVIFQHQDTASRHAGQIIEEPCQDGFQRRTWKRRLPCCTHQRQDALSQVRLKGLASHNKIVPETDRVVITLIQSNPCDWRRT